MKIINAFITASDSLEVSLQPGDALANSTNPGSWETKATAAGGRGIIWESPNALLETPQQYFGTVCKVMPKNIPSTVSVKVETDISTDMGQTFKPYTGEFEIQFVTPGEFTQLAFTATDAVSYKKVLP